MVTEASAEVSTNPYTYDAADFRSLNRYALPWWAWLPSLAVLSFLIWFFASLMWENGFDWLLAGILVVVVLLASGTWTWRPHLMRWNLRRQGLLVPYVVSIGSDYIRTESVRGDAHLRWSAVRRMKVTRDRLIIFTGRSIAFIIPRRAFDTDDQFEAFVTAAEHHWQQSTGVSYGT